ncbi:hypothetical protein N7494_003428 [Penicillium frequentans]|uniref:Sterol uptake control protein 2 n=1 Tax=Penicillium frequentans TaxID=3151616 RepID=A0AAD6D160_9EURO|nr:hypothetical protein N7494_003428 [Penicillium glabrum]
MLPEAQLFTSNTWASNSYDSSSTNPSFPLLDMTQLELVLQWINHTHKFAARSEKTRKVWEMPVLEEALNSPFLMHGILALSALHLSHLREDGRHVMWLDIAIAHKNTALVMFSDQLRNITKSNAKSMMVFAGLAFAFSLASAVDIDTKEDGPGLNALTDVFILARGVQTVLDAEADFLRQSNFKPLFDTTVPEVDIPENILAALDRLEQLHIRCSQWDNNIDSASYTRAIKFLRDLAAITCAEPTSMTMAAGWAIHASQRYLDDLKAKKPLALVVLAHYCVFLHMARENWCIGSWGRKVLLQIAQALEPDWHPHIEWATLNVFHSDTE